MKNNLVLRTQIKVFMLRKNIKKNIQIKEKTIYKTRLETETFFGF